MRYLILVFLCFSFFACSSQKIENSISRAPNMTPEEEENLSFLTAQDVTESLAKISDVDRFKVNISRLIRYYIIFGAHTQKVAASFDEKIKQGLQKSNNANTLESIKKDLKEINCQLMEVYALNHEIDEKIASLFKAVIEKQDAALNAWFIERFAVATNYDTPAQILTRLNYIRLIKNLHKNTCQNQVCQKMNFSNKLLRFPFDPFSDREALNWKNENIKDIALFSANTLNGSCLSRLPAAEAGQNYYGRSMPANTFSVTYDDGPDPEHTRSILSTWKNSNYPMPTYFWLAREALKYPAIVKEVATAGSEIACHSYSHADIGNIAGANSYDDLNRTNVTHFFSRGRPQDSSFNQWKEATLLKETTTSVQVLDRILAEPPRSTQPKVTKFRLPYGSGHRNPMLLNFFKNQNISHYHWVIDSLDWQDRNALSVFERVQKQMVLHKRGIILFHDIHPQSAKATEILVDYLKSQDTFQIVPLDISSR